jgi:hypothetical protein
MSALAEALLGQLAWRAADHRWLRLRQESGVAADGRHVRRDIQNRDANALVDFVSVTESFDTGRLLPFIPPSGAADVGTWQKRTKAWKRYAETDRTTFDRWQALMGFVDVRNALQHGLGQLTDLQLRHREQILGQIKAAGVNLNGDQLKVTRVDAERCYLTCTDYIRFLDALCPSA